MREEFSRIEAFSKSGDVSPSSVTVEHSSPNKMTGTNGKSSKGNLPSSFYETQRQIFELGDTYR